MKTFRFILLLALVCIFTVSCRKTSEEKKQDLLEDINDAMEPIDNMIKKEVPENVGDSEDEMIQEEINKIQDSISNRSLEN